MNKRDWEQTIPGWWLAVIIRMKYSNFSKKYFWKVFRLTKTIFVLGAIWELSCCKLFPYGTECGNDNGAELCPPTDFTFTVQVRRIFRILIQANPVITKCLGPRKYFIICEFRKTYIGIWLVDEDNREFSQHCFVVSGLSL